MTPSFDRWAAIITGRPPDPSRRCLVPPLPLTLIPCITNAKQNRQKGHLLTECRNRGLGHCGKSRASRRPRLLSAPVKELPDHDQSGIPLFRVGDGG